MQNMPGGANREALVLVPVTATVTVVTMNVKGLEVP